MLPSMFGGEKAHGSMVSSTDITEVARTVRMADTRPWSDESSISRDVKQMCTRDYWLFRC